MSRVSSFHVALRKRRQGRSEIAARDAIAAIGSGCQSTSGRQPPVERRSSLLLVALDFFGQLRDGIGIELFRLLDQLLPFLVALDEAVETLLGQSRARSRLSAIA